MTARRKVRHDLSLFTYTNEDPQNSNEIYNRIHSSLRIFIEHTFGQLKQTFKVFRHGRMSETKLFTLIRSLSALHNFIRETEGFLAYDLAFTDDERRDAEMCFDVYADTLEMNPDFLSSVNSAQSKRAEKIRDEISETLWEVYQDIKTRN